MGISAKRVKTWPDLTLKQRIIKGNVSTTRFDEVPGCPGSTLSYLIVHIDPPGLVPHGLAMIHRLIGLSSPKGGTAGSKHAA